MCYSVRYRLGGRWKLQARWLPGTGCIHNVGSIVKRSARWVWLAGTLLASSTLAGLARANDSTAELGAGGLQLVYSDAIQLVSEDLYVSVSQVRVKYRFRNVSDAAVTTLVAFPLPPIDAINPDDEMVVLPDPGSANFVDFTVTANGKPVAPTLYERASALGIDRTAELAKLRLPLNPLVDGVQDRLDSLTAGQIDQLARLGLIEAGGGSADPDWHYEAVFYWQQTFPPGKETEVEHTYKPVAAYGLFAESSLDEQWYKDNYCIDAAFAAGAAKLLKPVIDSDNAYLYEERITYILTTATNWAGPIHEFNLTVDSGEPDAIASFCAESVRKTSPTTYEYSAEDYNPEKDLQVLIVKPYTP